MLKLSIIRITLKIINVRLQPHLTEANQLMRSVESWITCVSFGESSSILQYIPRNVHTVFALLCFVVVIHWLIFPYPSGLFHWHWQSNDCPSASKATLMNMDEYFLWIHYERLHNHNKAKHNETVCIFLGIYCTCYSTGKIVCADQKRKKNNGKYATYFVTPSLQLTNQTGATKWSQFSHVNVYFASKIILWS